MHKEKYTFPQLVLFYPDGHQRKKLYNFVCGVGCGE